VKGSERNTSETGAVKAGQDLLVLGNDRMDVSRQELNRVNPD
jgi:hypothetical protein